MSTGVIILLSIIFVLFIFTVTGYMSEYYNIGRCGHIALKERDNYGFARAAANAVPEVNMIKFEDFLKLRAIKPENWFIYDGHVGYSARKDGSDYVPFYFSIWEFWRYYFWRRSYRKAKYDEECQRKRRKLLGTTYMSWQKDIDEYRAKYEAEIASAREQADGIAQKMTTK